MTATSSATAFARSSDHDDTDNRTNSRKRLLLWLRSWYQVLIAELLHVLDRRSYSHTR